MSATDFLDTNILVYAVTPADPRWPVASALLGQGGTISVQVLNEFANVARRKLRKDWLEISQVLADIRTACPQLVPLTIWVHERAVSLAANHSFAFYDALIVAAALESNCTVLMSEDMQDGQVIGARLTIRNPFRTP